MGFSNQFINFIKILYKNNTIVINNGFLSLPIYLQGGLRQSCPLSLPLYVIQGEITTTNINKNENIKGIKILNKRTQIKIGQYADDSNFLLTKQESIAHVLDFFHKLEKATGATINLEKTKVLPINTDQTNYIQEHITNINKLEQHQYIKILGISFSEELKETILANWQIILTKMENHIKNCQQDNYLCMGKHS